MSKIIKRSIVVILGLVIAGLAFIYLMPGYDIYLVRSESMVPAIRLGDLVVMGPVNGPINGTLEPGRIITYLYGNDRITHRVVSVDARTVVMKGDALQHPDPWTVNLKDVTGVYLFKIPFIGFLLNFMRTKLGWFLAIIIPTGILVSALIWEILKEAFKDEKKVSKKVERKPRIKEQETISKPQVTISKAQAENNARLREVLLENLAAQKTPRK